MSLYPVHCSSLSMVPPTTPSRNSPAVFVLHLYTKLSLQQKNSSTNTQSICLGEVFVGLILLMDKLLPTVTSEVSTLNLSK